MAKRKYKPTPAVKAARRKWIKALRSGKFKQTAGVLCRMTEGQSDYCCLGVACQVLGGVKRHDKQGGVVKFGREDTNLPRLLVNKLGLVDGLGSPARKFDGGNPELTERNDTYCQSFNKIADALETGDYWRENIVEPSEPGY